MANILIITFAALGLFLSWYIYHKKGKKEKLVCFVGDDCNKVIKSRYSKVLGIDNEIIGIFYYAFIIILALSLFLGIDAVAGIPVFNLLIIMGALASLFAVALLVIQAFVIKEWCEYCLLASAITIVIFAIEIIAR